jgi:hypothetical protein
VINKSAWSVFLAFIILTVLVGGCTSALTTPPVILNSDWLITEKDLNGFTDDIGIYNWQREEDLPGDYRICRSFSGVSWSVSPNVAANCINHGVPPLLKKSSH